MTSPHLIGASVRRKEDPRLITGQGIYVDDIKLPGMVYLAFLRSPHANARLLRLDAGKALARPGVQAVFTGKDVEHLAVPAITLPGQKVPRRTPLAVDRVHFVGEPVAAVVAGDRYLARDALEEVQEEYEPLPAVVDPERAVAPDAPLVHQELGTNVALQLQRKGGDPDRAFQEADRVVQGKFVHQRVAPSPMEPRGVLAHYQPGPGILTVWTSTQSPHMVRDSLASLLGLPQHRVRVIAPEVGGGFGSKAGIAAEQVLVAFVAMKLGAPVKWIEDRSENLLAGPHGRGQVQWAEAAVTRDGALLGVRYRFLVDLGAYISLFSTLGGLNTLTHSLGCYRIPNVAVDLSYVLTNATPIAPYRGNGRPEGVFVIERTMDLVAQELGLDPAEVRRRNFISKEAFPYRTPLGVSYDTGDYAKALELALKRADYEKLRAEQRELRERGRYLGIGVSSYVESAAAGPPNPAFGGWESARVSVQSTGQVMVYSGASPHGQGDETPFAQIAAQELGAPYEAVTVLHGDTEAVPEGLGSFGSRSLVVGGSAVYSAAQKVREKLVRIAAHAWGLSPQQVALQDSVYRALDGSGRTVTLLELARMAYDSSKLPPGMEPGLEATSFFQPQDFTYPFGCQVAVVEVEPQTGEIQVKRWVAVEDCGTAVNPKLVEGQVHGGIAQGIGQALYEQAFYDPESGQLLTSNFMNYAFPNAEMLPSLETDHTETPTPRNPLGAKGVGEAGAVGAPPALANAVADALAPFGVRHIDTPMTPEKVWRALEQAPPRPYGH